MKQVSQREAVCFEKGKTKRSRTCWAFKLSSKPSGISDFSLGLMASIEVRSKVASWPSTFAEDDDVFVLFDDHAGEDASVARGDDRARESFANLGAGVDDVPGASFPDRHGGRSSSRGRAFHPCRRENGTGRICCSKICLPGLGIPEASRIMAAKRAILA